MKTKKCTKCKVIKNIDKFSKRKRSKDGLFSWCKKCDSIRSKNYQKNHLKEALLRSRRYRESHRNLCNLRVNIYNKKHLAEKTLYMKKYRKKHPIKIKLYYTNYNCMKSHGITLRQKKEMILKQNNKCLVCGRDLRQLNSKKIHVDHDHKTKKNRGILCHYCNTALGFLKEDLKNVYKLAKYVKKYCKK